MFEGQNMVLQYKSVAGATFFYEQSLNLATASKVQAVREAVGLWLRDTHTFVRFTGVDAASRLYSQTTNDVEALESGEGHANALLNRQGRLQAHFTPHRWEGEYWMIVEKVQQEDLLTLLDEHLFIEDVTIHRDEGEFEQLLVQGPFALPYLVRSLKLESAAAPHLFPFAEFGCHSVELMGHEALAFRMSLTGEDGYVLVLEAGEGRMLADKLVLAGLPDGCPEIEPDVHEIMRVESGLPRFGVDVDPSCLIPETTLERNAFIYEKGGYLGQEVAARPRAYGSVKHALMGLQFVGEPTPLPDIGTPMLVDGEKADRIVSSVFIPTLDSHIALAYIDRDHRAPDSRLAFLADSESGEAQSYEVIVKVLPFVRAASRRERAEALYENAIALFDKGLEDEEASAIPLLEEAILLDPAYEASA
jgi:folate-binding protein YgfZ